MYLFKYSLQLKHNFLNNYTRNIITQLLLNPYTYVQIRHPIPPLKSLIKSTVSPLKFQAMLPQAAILATLAPPGGDLPPSKNFHKLNREI